MAQAPSGLYTNFPNGVTSFGVPMLGGINGIPLDGNWWFCDAVSGSDGNTGSATDPFATLTAAYAAATEGQNDVVVMVSRPTTAASTRGTQRLSSTLTWAKSATHLIGMGAPTMIGQRARIAPPAAATTNINPLLAITCQGSMFLNFSIFQGIGQSSTAEQLCDLSGQRNYFGNVAFQGMGSANGAGQPTSYVLNVNGGSENTFAACQIGTDTEARTAANCSIKFAGAASRNMFYNCIIPMFGTSATALFINCNSTGSMDRFNLFSECIFNNAVNSGAGTALTAAVSTSASAGGTIIMDRCTMVGVSNYSATNPDPIVKVTGSVPNGHTSGIALSSATA